MRVLVLGTVLQLISVITGSDQQRRGICRDLGFVATNDFVTVKFQSVTEDELQISIACSDVPDIWCRVVFSGNCSCVQHNTTEEHPPGFPGQISFDKQTIEITINKSSFPSYSGSFVACAVDSSIYKVLHIASTHTTLNNNDAENSQVRQAAVSTIIVCLLSILICVGPCFVLTFIGKYRQEQLRQKIIEEEKECTTNNVLGSSKLHREASRPVFERNLTESSFLFSKNSTSSAGSIYSIGGDYCFKQELLAHGRTSDYWRGVYTGTLPCGSDKNSVCIKVLIGTGQEKALLAEAEFLKQLPPHNHIINFLLSVVSKGEVPVIIYELAKYRDLYSFLCAKRKAMVTQTKDQWTLLGPNVVGGLLSAYSTPDQPSLLIDVPALETYSPLDPFKAPLLEPLSDLDHFVFAHQIACGMEYLSTCNIVHKQLTCESVLIFENFILKLTNFDISTSDQPDKPSTSTRAPAIERAQVIVRTISGRPSVKWQAPEVMKSEAYSTESDVWSYGMTLWELTNYGDTPFDDVVLRLLLRAIEEESYPLKAENCSSELYSLMKSCWKRKGHRPSFTDLLNSIHENLMKTEDSRKTGTIRLDDNATGITNQAFEESYL